MIFKLISYPQSPISHPISVDARALDAQRWEKLRLLAHELKPQQAPIDYLERLKIKTLTRLKKSTDSHTSSRLEQRIQDINCLTEFFKKNTEIHFLGILGWDSSCQIKVPAGMGFSQMDCILFEKEGHIYIEHIGSSWQLFSKYDAHDPHTIGEPLFHPHHDNRITNGGRHFKHRHRRAIEPRPQVTVPPKKAIHYPHQYKPTHHHEVVSAHPTQLAFTPPPAPVITVPSVDTDASSVIEGESPIPLPPTSLPILQDIQSKIEDAIRKQPPFSITFLGLEMDVTPNPDRHYFVIRTAHKQKRFQLMALLSESSRFPHKKFAHIDGKIRVNAAALYDLFNLPFISFSGIRVDEVLSLAELESTAATHQHRLGLWGLEELTYSKAQTQWSFKDSHRQGRFFISTDQLALMVQLDTDVLTPFLIKQRAPLLSRLAGSFGRRALWQGQGAKSLVAIGALADPRNEPFIDGIDDLDVAIAQAQVEITSVLKAFIVLPFAIAILQEGVNGATDELRTSVASLESNMVMAFKTRLELAKKKLSLLETLAEIDDIPADLGAQIETIKALFSKSTTDDTDEERVGLLSAAATAGAAGGIGIGSASTTETIDYTCCFESRHDAFQTQIKAALDAALETAPPTDSPEIQSIRRKLSEFVPLLQSLVERSDKIEDLKGDVRMARWSKEAITAMSYGLRIHFASEGMTIPAHLIAGTAADGFSTSVEDLFFPTANYFASYGQLGFSIISFLNARQAFAEAGELSEAKTQVLSRSVSALFPDTLKAWQTDIATYLGAKSRFKYTESALNGIVSAGQLLMLGATIAAACEDGGASLSLLGGATSAAAQASGYIHIMRSAGAAATLVGAGGNSAVSILSDKRFEADDLEEWEPFITGPEPVQTKLARVHEIALRDVLPQFLKAKMAQLVIANKRIADPTQLFNAIFEAPSYGVITKSTGLKAHYHDDARPYYRDLNQMAKNAKDVLGDWARQLIKGYKEDPIQFYLDVLCDADAVDEIPTDPTERIVYLLSVLRTESLFDPFYERLMDRVVIGTSKRGYTYKGTRFQDYFIEVCVHKKRKAHVGNPARELVGFMVSKTASAIEWSGRQMGYDPHLKGPSYYKTKKALTLQVDLPFFMKEKHLRQFNFSKFFHDLRHHLNPDITGELYGIMLAALDDVIEENSRKNKRRLRSVLFELPQALIKAV